MERRILCFFLPHLSSDRVARGAGRASPQALAFVQYQRSTYRVAALSEGAERAGARAGMTLAQARAILPALRDLPHDPNEDRRALERLAVLLGRFSPIVGIVGERELALDVTGCAALFGSEERLARLAAATVHTQGYGARWALASTPTAARALAAHGPTPTFVGEPGSDLPALVPLPTAALGIDAEAASRLAALGVRTIGDLLRLPRGALAARVGAEVPLAIDRALGRAPDPVPAHRPRELPRERWVFAGAVDRLESLVLAVDGLARNVAAQLEGLRLGARALSLGIERPDAPPERCWVSLSEPRREATWFMTLLRTRLERIDLGIGVTAVELAVEGAEELAHGEPAMFEMGDGSKPNVAESLRALLDRFAARLGEKGFGWVSLREDDRPERSWELGGVAPAREERTGAGRGAEAAAPPSLPRRPLRLLAPPRPIEVEWDPDGAPARVRDRGESWHRIARAAGPEHVETGWWDGAPVARAYFAARREDGPELWLYRDLATGRGFLHGLFA